ncbi:hypothetical protein ODV97_17920 [Enterococcus gallinarum]|nr:hypothetical protein [Enterococcus gallinarum]
MWKEHSERAYFSFQKSGKRDTTSGFKIIVQGNADIDAPEAETIITEYNRLVEKLNKAYQDALKKINSDYDVVVARIEEITIEITKLKAQISETIANTEKTYFSNCRKCRNFYHYYWKNCHRSNESSLGRITCCRFLYKR